ncbi:MAG: DUF4105 domain-containing protein [Halioglobus sp.]
MSLLNNLFVRAARSFAAPPSGHPVRFVGRAILIVPVFCALFWSAAALWIDGPESELLAGGLVAALLLLWCAVMLFIRPFWRSVLAMLLLVALVWGWWLTLAPSNDREWLEDVAQLPVATLNGSQLTINNVRTYGELGNPESTLDWTTQTYDLDELIGFDIVLSFWGPSAYGHTMTSWEFADGRHLTVSIETRKEKSEEYSAVRGFFRQFELYYVVASEADLIALRTRYRGEQVELYRVFTPDDGAKAMLLDYVKDINELAAKPRWYNAVIANCTTLIWRHAKAIGSSFPLDWRLLANGFVVELGYELGTVNNTMSYPELRAASDITERAVQAADNLSSAQEFSRAIRVGLPERPSEILRRSLRYES